MKPTLVAIAVALSLGTLAACDRSAPDAQKRSPTPTATPTPSAPASTGSSSTTQTSPTTPANVGTPSAAEKKDGSNPVQGQVDPKQPAQQKDFQQKGDAAGPKK